MKIQFIPNLIYKISNTICTKNKIGIREKKQTQIIK